MIPGRGCKRLQKRTRCLARAAAARDSMDPMSVASAGFLDVPDAGHALQVAAQLALAATLGGVLGYERQRLGKAAGTRTHMLVALGAALFALVAVESGMSASDLSRVIQGIVAGVGFLGAGTILKVGAHEEVHGLTTAAGLWFTAAVGT